MPKLSVCIPTYGRADVLPKVIASVLAQTYEDFELLIFDDASPDDTEEVVKQFTDKRIRYHRHKVNLGVRDNWNFAVKNTGCEYVFKLDDDDYIHPSFLEKTISLLEKHKNIGSAYTGFYYAKNYDGEWLEAVADKAFVEGDYMPGMDYVRGYLLNGAIPKFHPSSVVFRNSVAKDICFFDKAANDLMFSLALATKADVGYIPEPLFYYVQHASERASYEKNSHGLFGFEPTKFIEDFFKIDFIKDNAALVEIREAAMKKGRITRSLLHIFMCRKGLNLRNYLTAVLSLFTRDKKLLVSPLFLAGLLIISTMPRKFAVKLSYMYKSRQIFASLAKIIHPKRDKRPHADRN